MTALLAVYGFCVAVSAINLFGMLRLPRNRSGKAKIVVLIPARNEAKNLPRLLESLAKDQPVIVFDDESEDETAAIARSFGARVLNPDGPIEPGWTGKNRACHALCRYSIENTDCDWMLLLDADTEASPNFLDRLVSAADNAPDHIGVLTGIPKICPGQGLEPLVSAWVGWIILASNPFGLVDRTGIGHNMFLNGQVQLWRRDVYPSVDPHRSVRHRVMEDVAMGRLLAKRRIGVQTFNLTNCLNVRMYQTAKEALDGFSKNSFEITNSYLGSILLACLLLAIGWAWLLAPVTWFVLSLSGLLVALAVRAPVWPALLMPIVLSIGAFTILRSAYWRKSGKTQWKGRTYA